MRIQRGGRRAYAFPDDWEQPITKCGFSKSESNKGYQVRVSAGGKQLYVALAITQDEAAALYDLALWKLAPKLSKRPTPNFPEDFPFLNQAQVDRDCPRLNQLYADTPFLKSTDEFIDEAALRAAALAGPAKRRCSRAMSQYDDFVRDLRRNRIALVEMRNKLELSQLKLPWLRKLAEAPVVVTGIDDALKRIEEHFKLAESSLENQRPYYEKQSIDNPLPE